MCLLGYRGIGYSAEYAENMTAVHQKLRETPETIVEIIKGPDLLCAKYPSNKTYHCQDEDIYVRDNKILTMLGLQDGHTYQWQDIISRIIDNIQPKDCSVICESCSWLSYGYCEEGIRDIREGIGLKVVK